MILWGRTEKCLKETAEEITLSGTECHYFVCDVANREEVYKQAKVIREKVHQPCIFISKLLSHLVYRLSTIGNKQMQLKDHWCNWCTF